MPNTRAVGKLNGSCIAGHCQQQRSSAADVAIALTPAPCTYLMATLDAYLVVVLKPSTGFVSKALDRWSEGGARRRLKKEKEEQEDFKVASLRYDANGLTLVSYKKCSRHFRGTPTPGNAMLLLIV